MDANRPDLGLADRLQARAESSRAGRAILSVLVGALVATIAVASFLGDAGTALFGGKARERILSVQRPFADRTGLDQLWNVFAPNPRGLVFTLHAEVRYADGSTKRWDVPDGGDFVGAYRIYRWRKWVEYARGDDYARLFYPTAIWIAREHSKPDKPVEHVALIRRWYDIPPPGQEQPAWREYRYYELDVAPGEL